VWPVKEKKTEERLNRRVDKKRFAYGGINLEIKHKTIFDRAAENDDGKNDDSKHGLLKKRKSKIGVYARIRV